MDDNEHVNRPQRPNLQCIEHEAMCDVLHSIHGRVCMLEQRVRMLEEAEAKRHNKQ